MKKFIYRTLSFFFFAGLFYIFASFIWGRYAPLWLKPNIQYRNSSYGHMYSRISEVKNKKNIDLLFVGSSHAYRGFDTRIFTKKGLKTFNLGSGAQTPIQTKVLLKRYLKTLNPRTVIYEVYPETFIIDGVESSLDIISYDHNDWSSLEMAFKINNIKTYNTFLYGLVGDLLNLHYPFSEPVQKNEDTYIPGGFVERKMEYYKPVNFKKKKIELDNTQLASFRQIVSILKKNDVDLILVYAPIPSSNYKSYSNIGHFDSIMKSYSNYYNFNEMIDLNDSLHFYDSHHLNQSGVEIFNEKLFETLNKN